MFLIESGFYPDSIGSVDPDPRRQNDPQTNTKVKKFHVLSFCHQIREMDPDPDSVNLDPKHDF